MKGTYPLKYNTLYIKKINIVLLALVPIYFLGFFFFGEPSLTGEIAIRTFADSLTYESIAIRSQSQSDLELVSASSNLLGPVLLIETLNYNYFYIFLFNLFLVLFSIQLIFRNYRCNIFTFTFFILFNPLVFFSLFNANKEVFIILNVALFIDYMKKNNALVLVGVLILSFFIRWHLTLFFLVLISMYKLNKSGFSKIWLLIMLLVSLSILFPLMNNVFGKVIDHALSDEDVGGSGIFTKLNTIQGYFGGYIISFIPKFLQLNLGIISRSDNFLRIDSFWNYTVLLSHAWMTLFLFMFSAYKKVISIKDDFFYFVVVFAVIFSITPISNVRYFLPMYLILAFIVSKKDLAEIN